MRLRDVCWMDVERYLQTDDRIIIITGATEQHAYLSLLTDILIPEKIADAVIQQEPVLIAPPLNFGVSQLFVDFPGTISITQKTFEAVLMEVVQCLMSQGFAGFFFFNGHGGNAQPDELAEMQLNGMLRYDWYDWWQAPAATTFAQANNLRIDHANWGENFPFNRVGQTIPDTEKEPVNLEMLDGSQPIMDVLGDGSFGGKYQVDNLLIIRMFDAIIEEVVARLRALRQT